MTNYHLHRAVTSPEAFTEVISQFWPGEPISQERHNQSCIDPAHVWGLRLAQGIDLATRYCRHVVSA
jgi:hypothetical protein